MAQKKPEKPPPIRAAISTALLKSGKSGFSRMQRGADWAG